jgi:L-asparagine transporter-like permease
VKAYTCDLDNCMKNGYWSLELVHTTTCNKEDNGYRYLSYGIMICYLWLIMLTSQADFLLIEKKQVKKHILRMWYSFMPCTLIMLLYTAPKAFQVFIIYYKVSRYFIIYSMLKYLRHFIIYYEN